MKIFLSCVSTEFRSYRLKLANQLGALKGQPYKVKVQEDFQQGGFTLLHTLDEYIQNCDLVIHLIGEAAGAQPTLEHEQTLLQSLGEHQFPPGSHWSYTQWEYHLARRYGKRVLVYMAGPDAPRDCGRPVSQRDDEAQLQKEHLEFINNCGEHWTEIDGQQQLVREVFHDLGLELNLKINNLPYKTLGTLFKGREDFLEKIRTTLAEAEHRGHQRVTAITADANAATVHGLGGIGKTRAAIEYAHRHSDEYTALLFVRADSPEGLKTNLAALCGTMVLDLAEKETPELDAQVAAALQWLKQHPGWLLILDNVDSEEAAQAVENLLGQLSGSGQMLITSRLSNWSGGVETLALDILTETDAVDFLLERTATRRRKQTDDQEQARQLAITLGQLALALEQAGAMIEVKRMSFTQYLEQWQHQHEQVLTWFDARLMQYPMSVAVTWQTSFDQLNQPARELLYKLAWFAPDPIPENLLTVKLESSSKSINKSKNVINNLYGSFRHIRQAIRNRWVAFKSILKCLPDVHVKSLFSSESVETKFLGNENNLYDALANLESYSLVTISNEKSTFLVHRLVQDITRRRLQNDGIEHRLLLTALEWIKEACNVDPTDVRAWSTLDPLAPHAQACARYADEAKVSYPTSRLLSLLGILFYSKGQYAETEPLMRRALEIDEAFFGYNHPIIASDLNCLSSLLIATKRFNEAEPLIRRSIVIYENNFGKNHHQVANCLSNLAVLLLDTDRLNEAEPLIRRALSIDESNFGKNHPDVAIRLNNLAYLLRVSHRFEEAEPIIRRALSIDEVIFGDKHPNVAIRLGNLAQVLQKTNRLQEAEHIMQRCVSILFDFSRKYNLHHPDLQTAINNYNSLLLQMNLSQKQAALVICELAKQYGFQLNAGLRL